MTSTNASREKFRNDIEERSGLVVDPYFSAPKIKEENGKVVVNISDPETTMDDVVNMTDRCRKENNSCCGPQFFEKMTDFYVSGKDGDVDINMVGDGITKHKMEEKLGQCDCLEDGD